MKRHLVALLLLPLAACAAGDPYGLSQLLADEASDRVLVSALVVDLDTGETLLAQDPRRLLRPASTMKLLTTASVCRHAPDGEVTTTLAADAVPEGAVTLLGKGDPFLTADDVRALVQKLHDRGLERVRDGRVDVVDPLRSAERFGEGWMWDDEPSTFQPAMSAAAVDGGCVTVEVTPTADGIEARLLPTAGALQLEVEPGPDALRVTRGRYHQPNRVRVAGDIIDRDDSGTERRNTNPVHVAVTVPDPAAFTGAVLADALRDEGLTDGAVTATVRERPRARAADGRAVTLRRSVADIVVRTNKISDNLGAEMLLRLLATVGEGAQPLGPDATARGLAVLDRDIAALGLDPDGFRIADGSGVSHYTLVSAELLVATLVDLERRGGQAFEVFEASLPDAGVDGTLGSRMRESQAVGRVRAKTGTLSGVSNLAGYVDTASGRRLAFAVLVQNFVGSARRWRDLQDRFCVALAEL